MLALKPILASLAAVAAAAAAVVVPATLDPAALPPAAASLPSTTDGCVSSLPDPGSSEKVPICYTLFRPGGASRTSKVPVIVHSHGWGGSRTEDFRSFGDFLAKGYAVLSFDQRGFGESGGQAQVMNPYYEGRDVAALVRMLASQDWILKDGPGDPRMGAIGGSYGGGFQFAGAFRHLMVGGEPVFDALAPEITWHDLNQSLAPRGVPRGQWVLALAASAMPSDALPTAVKQALVVGVATGTWPDGSLVAPSMTEFFEKNGPRWHVAQGRRLDIPVLLGQGTNDGLFPLEQGLQNFQKALTATARANSIFIGYNGGHVIPGVFPTSVIASSDPCSRKLGSNSFRALSLRFFDEQLKGRRTGLTGFGRYHLATPAGTCTTVASVAADQTFAVGTVATPELAGPPLLYEVARGPIRLAGNAHLTATMTALGVHNRAFYGLAVGTSPLDAQLVQGNVLPVNEPSPVIGEPRRIQLPAVAVDVPRGKSLYLLVTAVSDTFASMGSRTPGAILLENTRVSVPVVG